VGRALRYAIRQVSKRYYLVRHGIPALQGVLLGQKDVSLSEEGRRQAIELGRQLEPEHIDRIISSSLKRALETAQLIASSLGLSVEIEERLNEISYGEWDGLTWEQIMQQDPAAANQKQRDWWAVTPAGGETAREFLDRVREAWESILAHPSRRTVIVAHQGVNAVVSELSRTLKQPGEGGVDWQRISGFEQSAGTFREIDLAG
jgi:broad specificity phosphatase PhoE